MMRHLTWSATLILAAITNAIAQTPRLQGGSVTTTVSRTAAAAPALKSDETTRIEALNLRKGSLVVKSTYPIGSLSPKGLHGKVDVKGLLITAPPSQTSASRGLQITGYGTGRFETDHTAFVDIDEIEDSSKAIGYMVETATKWKETPPEAYTEIHYRPNRGTFECGIFTGDSGPSAFVDLGGESLFLDLDELARLKDFINQGLTLLNGK